MGDYSFFPQPKEISLVAAVIGGGISGFEIANGFSNRLRDAAVKKLGNCGAGRKLLIQPADNMTRIDEYLLKFEESRIVLEAGSERAAFYGLCTLQQMLASTGLPASGEIRDWADLELRILMIDLKRVGWNFDYLLGLPERIAELKINAVLMEYEDKVKFDFCDTIPVMSAFSQEQIKSFVTEAGANYLEIIPLVQCLGHWEYILKHEKYAQVRELPDYISMGCPTNPATFELFVAMAGEIMALHPDSRYFHIGADETRLLGKCERCAPQAAEKGKASLYADHVGRVIAWVKERGKTPLFWGDMLLNHPEISPLFDRDAVVVDWDYEPSERRIDKIRFRPCLENIGEMDYLSYRKLVPPTLQEQFAPHVQASEQTKDFDSLPNGTYFQSQGYRVIGASNVFKAGNVLLHSDNATRKNLLGNLATYWGASNSLTAPYNIYEGRWAGACMVGASGWNAEYEWEHRDSYYARFAASYQKRPDLAPLYRAITETRMLIPAGGPRVAKTDVMECIRRTGELAVDPATLPHSQNARLTQSLAKKCRVELELDAWRKAALSQPLLSADAYREIDLSGIVNDRFTHEEELPGWSRDRNNDLASMPKGRVCYQGIPFHIIPDRRERNAAALVGEREGKPYFPRAIRHIPVGGKARYLSFLHCLVEADTIGGQVAGHYIIHYADGSEERIPLVHAKNIGGWWHATDLPEAPVAWSGPNLRCPEVGIHCFVHEVAKPDVVVTDIDLEGDGSVIIALAALTAIAPVATSGKNDKAALLMRQIDEFVARLDGLRREWRELLPSFVTPESTEEICNLAFSNPVRALQDLRKMMAAKP
jgi:hypothetical protein